MRITSFFNNYPFFYFNFRNPIVLLIAFFMLGFNQVEGQTLRIPSGTSGISSTGADAHGGRLFQLYGPNGRNLQVASFYSSQGQLRTRIGINYGVNGTTGINQYAIIGGKKAPVIEFSAENGSISFYGESGSGSGWRTPLHNLGLFVQKNGKVGIGTNSPDQELTVAGKINAEEIILEDVAGADFVFEEDYDLRSLSATEQFIKANKHLPEIPSAAEMAEEGLEIKAMNILLLQKVEELTLHLIRMEKEIEMLKAAQNND